MAPEVIMEEKYEEKRTRENNIYILHSEISDLYYWY
jgi:hypothetical protein